MAFEEKTYISEFNVLPTKSIAVRKTTNVTKNGQIISESYWRCILSPNDEQTQQVLGDYPYYYQLAQDVWKNIN